MKSLTPATVFLMLLCMAAKPLRAQYDYKWQTDGTVNTSFIENNTLYIAGSFTYVGQYAGNMVVTDPITGAWDKTWPVFNESVYCIMPDGSGGWFVGGAFTLVNGVSRVGIARIRPDKTLDLSWAPSMTGGVFCMVRSGNTLYVGGNITMVSGQARANIAAIDIPTAIATSWNPSANSTVNSIEFWGGSAYIGGNFSTVGGQPRSKLASVDIATGAVSSWDPNVTAGGIPNVTKLLISGNTLYVGGFFNFISGQPRNHIAAFDLTSGNLTSWSPMANSSVGALAIDGSTLYVGGSFNNIGGQIRRNIAALDVVTGTANAFNPIANGTVARLLIVGNLLYTGGQFTSIGGQTRRKLAALDMTMNTNNATSWDPIPGNGWDVYALHVDGNGIWAGGSFTSINGQYRNNLAAIDLTTNTLKPWNPNANGNVNVICPSGSTLYAGGDFTTMTGQPRNRIAAIDATGAATAWNPAADASVRAIAMSITGDTVYAGGDFNNIGGQPRTKIAAISASANTNNALAWNAAANGTVRALVLHNDTIYAGGDFTSIGGQSRSRTAALSIKVNTNNATAWTADANNTVHSLAWGNGVLYAGGDFTSLGAQLRSRIGSIRVDGTVTDWNPGANGTIRDITPVNSFIYVAGNFTLIGGSGNRQLAALDAGTNTNNALNWNPFTTPGSSFLTIAVERNIVYAGGSFMNNYSDRTFFLTFIVGLDLLPIRTNQLAVNQQHNNCYISWSVPDKTADASYEVQRSTDGKSFVGIRPMSIQLASNTITDANLAPGTYYYRLRSEYASGAVQYSNIVRVVVGVNDNRIQIPSLVNRSMPITLQSTAENNILFIVNNQGQTVWRQALQKGSNTISLPALTNGLYYYSIRHNTQQIQTGKIFISAVQ